MVKLLSSKRDPIIADVSNGYVRFTDSVGIGEAVPRLKRLAISEGHAPFYGTQVGLPVANDVATAFNISWPKQPDAGNAMSDAALLLMKSGKIASFQITKPRKNMVKIEADLPHEVYADSETCDQIRADLESSIGSFPGIIPYVLLSIRDAD
jgi:hypothetical protein